jgi:hypothetical protein
MATNKENREMEERISSEFSHTERWALNYIALNKSFQPIQIKKNDLDKSQPVELFMLSVLNPCLACRPTLEYVTKDEQRSKFYVEKIIGNDNYTKDIKFQITVLSRFCPGEKNIATSSYMVSFPWGKVEPQCTINQNETEIIKKKKENFTKWNKERKKNKNKIKKEDKIIISSDKSEAYSDEN